MFVLTTVYVVFVLLVLWNLLGLEVGNLESFASPDPIVDTGSRVENAVFAVNVRLHEPHLAFDSHIHCARIGHSGRRHYSTVRTFGDMVARR